MSELLAHLSTARTLALWHLERLRTQPLPSEGDAMRHPITSHERPDLPRFPSVVRPSRGDALAVLLVCVVFYLAARVGLVLHFPNSLVYFVWPPSAVLFVALLLSPRRIWWLYAVALLPVHMIAELGMVSAPAASLVLFYGIVWVQALVGALCVEQLTERPLRLDTLRTLIIVLLGGAGAAAFTEAVTLATVLELTTRGAHLGLNFAQTLLADALTMVVLAPALIVGWGIAGQTWRSNGPADGGPARLSDARRALTAWLRTLPAARVIEGVLVAVGLLGIGLVAFGGYISLPAALPALLYAALPLLLWTAARFGLGGTSLALCGLTLLSIMFAIHRRGPFSSLTTTEDLFSLQLFFIAISVPLLILAVLMKERQHAQRRLAQSEERYRDLVESQTDMICRYLPDSTLTYVNAAYCRHYRKPREQLIGKKFLDMLKPSARAHHAEYTAALLSKAGSSEDEHEVTLPNGTTGWQQWLDHAIRDASGAVVEVQSIGRDITDRKRAEEALRASEERYRAVVNNLPHGVVLLFGADLRHLFADGQGLPDFGLVKDAVEGKSVWEIFAPELAETLAPQYQTALSGEPVAFDIAHNGHTYQVQIVPIRYAGATAGLAMLQDVTEQRRAELLAELDRAKTAFFSNVSHEFRTPLTLLLGPAADALADRDEPLPPRQRERLELIQRGGLRLHKLVNSLLDFSRIEAGRVKATYQPTDVSALTANLASTFRSAIERASLRLDVECADLASLPQPVYIDREMWEQIVLNLLSNALKFTFEGRITVTVRASESHEHVELEVRDTGTGIAAEQLPHLFERFYRVQGVRARTHEGTGIGLALVQELVRLHGGTIRVSSALGTGSTFTVAIPTGTAHLPADRIAPETPADALPLRVASLPAAPLFVEEALRWLPDPASPEPPAPSERSGDGVETILAADDNADMRDYLARLLGVRWRVETVADGTQALAAARAQLPNVIVADVMMPGLDGVALIAALRETPKTRDVPIILLSARAGDEATVEGLRAGADDYLVKPFSARELLARVQTHLDLARMRREAAERATQLDAIFDTITDGVFVIDAHGGLARINPAGRRLFGLADDDTVPATPGERAQVLDLRNAQGNHLAPDQLPTVRLLRGEVLAGATAQTLVLRAHTGEMRTVSLTGAPLRDRRSGHIVGAVAVFRDITELKRTQEALSKQERLFRTLVENSPDIITRFDRNLRHLYASPASELVTGIPALRRLGKTYAEIGLPAAVYTPWEDALRRVIATGQPEVFETDYRVTAGPPRVSQVRYIPEFAANGTVESVLGVTSDITRLKRIEAELRASEERFSKAFNATPIAMAILSRTSRCIVDVNAAECQLTGYSRDELLGATVTELGLIDSADLDTLRTLWHAEHRVNEVPLRVHTKSGEIRSCLGSTETIQIGAEECLIVITRDVTQRERAQEALRRQERLFRTLVENSPDIIARFDRDLRYLYINPAIEKLGPLPAEAYIGKTNAELGWPEQDYAPAHHAISEVFETGQSRALEEQQSNPADGEHARFFRAQLLPEFAEDGTVASVLSVTNEITDLKRAETSLRAATAAAEAAQREEERRRHESERREQIAESLREILTILNSDRQMAKILDYIARQAGRLLSSDAAAIYTIETDGAQRKVSRPRTRPADGTIAGTLALRTFYGLPLPHDSSGGKRALAAGDAAIRMAMVAQRPVAVLAPSDAGPAQSHATATASNGHAPARTPGDGGLAGIRAEYLTLREEPLPAPYRALLAIPIIAQGQVYGGLLLHYTAPHRFSADEVALAAAYGDQIALAIANTRLQEHIEQAAIESERNRLARELHDTVTQEIFTASVLAEAIPRVWPLNQSEAEASLRQLHRLTRGALAALRALLLELRPAVLEQKALPDLLRQLGEAMATRSGVPITVSVADDCPSPPVPVKLAYYRIAQEALTNAAKYAHAQSISVQLRHLRDTGVIALEIRDDGQGYDTHAIPAGHFGIGMMRERARAVGASLRITSRLGQGTQVSVRWTESAHARHTKQARVAAGHL